MNLTLNEYEQLDNKQKKELIRTITTIHPTLKFDSFVIDSRYQLPRFWLPFMNMYFIYIPGGTFNMGLSTSEEQAALAISDPLSMNLAEMRPVTELTIKDFLVAETPFPNRHMLFVKSRLPDTYMCIAEPYPDSPY